MPYVCRDGSNRLSFTPTLSVTTAKHMLTMCSDQVAVHRVCQKLLPLHLVTDSCRHNVANWRLNMHI